MNKTLPSSKYKGRRQDQDQNEPELDYEDALDHEHDVPDYEDHDHDFKDDDDNVFLDSSSSTIVLSGNKHVHVKQK